MESIRFVGIDLLEPRRHLAWGPYPQLIDQDLAVENHGEINGSGVVVAVIDTGVDANHPQLQGVLWANPGEIPNNRIDDDGNGWIDDHRGYDFYRGDGDPNDENSHGTQMAGLIAAKKYTHPLDGQEYQGIAPGAKVVSLKIADAFGRTTPELIEKALQWLEANHQRFGIGIVNMSLRIDEPLFKGKFDDEVARLGAAGLLMIGSAGHWPERGGIEWPARDPNIYSAGLITVEDTISPKAQRGPDLDILAPGKGIPILHKGSAYLISGEASSYPPPFITGAAALVKQVNPEFTAAEIFDILSDSGARITDPGPDGRTYPRLDIDDAIALAKERADEPEPPPPPAQRPFGEAPFAVGQTIQAEDFDRGNEGIAFNETSKKVRKVYRSTPVNLRKTTDGRGGYDVTSTRAGEWLEYTLDVAKRGVFNFQARVQSAGSGGAIRLQIDGKNVGRPISITHKKKWQTVSRPKIKLGEGEHVVRIVFQREGTGKSAGSFNWFRFV